MTTNDYTCQNCGFVFDSMDDYYRHRDMGCIKWFNLELLRARARIAELEKEQEWPLARMRYLEAEKSEDIETKIKLRKIIINLEAKNAELEAAAAWHPASEKPIIPDGNAFITAAPCAMTRRWQGGEKARSEMNCGLAISHTMLCPYEKQFSVLEDQLSTARAEIAALKEDKEQATDALQKICAWAEAYPIDIFPEPDFKLVHKALEAYGITLDCVSASNMRHVITQVAQIAVEGLIRHN